eukprot:GHUV01041843.1.p1 GENE.GHUV01041843.1~~GHUV01041843.1.p1  ORF type:complete len:136 (+),score=10.07 GHUV01041843.1:43-450(+)
MPWQELQCHAGGEMCRTVAVSEFNAQEEHNAGGNCHLLHHTPTRSVLHAQPEPISVQCGCRHIIGILHLVAHSGWDAAILVPSVAPSQQPGVCYQYSFERSVKPLLCYCGPLITQHLARLKEWLIIVGVPGPGEW